MRKTTRVLLGVIMMAGMAAASGCADRHSMGDNGGTTAGGNGSFGTDPDRPGSHDQNNNPGTTPNGNGSTPSGQNGSGM